MITVFAAEDATLKCLRTSISRASLTIYRSFSIVVDRPLQLGRLVGWLVGWLTIRERNYHFPTVINLCTLVLKIIVVCIHNVLISMLMVRFDVRNNVSLIISARVS